MNTREKYNSDIEKIEKLIQNADMYTKPRDIALNLVNGVVADFDILDSVFNYLVGTTLIKYITERRIMAAYKYIAETGPRYNQDRALELSGYGDYPAMSKPFRQFFQLSPHKVAEKRDMSLYKMPATWENLSAGIDEQRVEDIYTYQPQETIFGISKEIYERIKEAEALTKLYEFDNFQSDLACWLADKYGLKLKTSFEYIDDFVLQFCEDENGRRTKSRDEAVALIEKSEELLMLYLRFNLSVNQALTSLPFYKRSSFIINDNDQEEYVDKQLSIDFWNKYVEYQESGVSDCFDKYYIFYDEYNKLKYSGSYKEFYLKYYQYIQDSLVISPSSDGDQHQ